MAARREVQQFEKLIDEVTRKKDFELLEQYLEREDCENISYKCSKQFVNKFDKLLCQELDKQEIKSVSTILSSLWKCGEKISIAGENGLPAMIKCGLIGKMVNWYEKLKEILILRGNEKNKIITSLAEDFFNILLIAYDSRPEGKMEMLENFVLRTCTIITDVRISIYVQQEVIRKLNLMLDSMPRDARKKIFSTKEMLLVMSDMGRRILDAGDYDLQVAITEALCRMIPEKQRRELACQWFSMEFVSNAFKGIKDSEFETDCRKFLNQVNGMLGDKRRVFTYPCLSAALDKYELQLPLDENLEEFWIDFNVGSRSVSFYVAADTADQQWETVIIPEEEVDLYNLEEKDSKKLLTIDLKSPMNVGNQEGEKFFLYFDSILEIEDVARKIYGLNKCKEFSKKKSMSVAKTTVHIVFDESGSQVMVPESQLSPRLEEKHEDDKFSKSKTPRIPGSQRSLNKNNQEKCKNGSPKITTSCKRKVSEASVLIPATARFSTRSPLVFLNTSTPSRGRFKLPLKMMSSIERSTSNAVNGSRTKNLDQEHTENGQRCTSDNELCEAENTRKSKIREEAELPGKRMSSEGVLKFLPEAENEATEKQTLDDALDIIPDSQRAGRSNKHLPPGHLGSASEKKTWKKRACSVPEKNITTGDRQKLNLSWGQASPTAPILSERAKKHKAFSSIFGGASPDKQINKRKQEKNETEITRERSCKGVSVSETSWHSDFPKNNNTKGEADVLSRKEATDHEKSKTKIKSKEITDATKSLISKISDRYKEEKSKTRDSLVFNRSCSNKSFLTANKENIQDRNLKTSTCLGMAADPSVYDVYNFNDDVVDEPTIKIGIQDCCVMEASTLKDLNKKEKPGESKTGSEMKAGEKTRYSQYKKHLFSDTDTEYRGDDSKTDISWLQKSKAPSKPQIVDYSRIKNIGKSKRKGKTSDKFSEPPCQIDTPKGKTAKKKKVNLTECKKQSSVIDEMKKETTRPKRPRRAAQPKNYKEPSSSESENEYSACAYKGEKSKVQKCVNEKNKNDSHEKDLQNLVEPKTVASCVNKALIKSKSSTEEKEIEMSSPESPASLERMRCAERISEEFVTQDRTSSEGSPGLQKLTPEIEETLNFEKDISPSNLCLQKKNTPNMYLNRSPEMTVKKLTFANKSFSPVLTASNLLNLTSLTPHKTYSGKNTEGSVSQICDADENLSFRRGFSDKISIEGKQQDVTKPVKKNKGEELSSASVSVSLSSASEVQSWSQEPYGPAHESGPSSHVFLKRKYQRDTESHSDEAETSKEEEKRRSRRTTLQPRKLFKTDEAVTYREYENLSAVSVSDPAALDVDIWEPGCSTIDICQKLQKEYTKKIESRSRKMEHFAKQSLRTANQHLVTMNQQLLECRIEQLDRFHFVILQEIESFEKDSQSLKNTEKELLTVWKKHKHTLSTFMKNEQQRLQILKTAFEKNIHHSVDYEENIFTSEVHLMKEDMKGLQEKFLKEMQEEELINVRRGLQTLFLAEGGKF
ncbi:synaptonemal complex protein 2 isoform X1 [Coturnix japonica]|uniref:synaptonemal complex protein 2 isoform X1 n=1 Tax=Coturnix japonica TaxID=93934 RepID=UPI0013A5E618|nr:synaptonemal complex protein 2 isoform X1 [Coturnix japonica]XP_032304428.1 synaptonemal complex protein 2 isoform X1 [Coturnix japonica]XP_032304430.1 synaptonemal complex protein 2 isoform X1 [Coturnix japonica]XP_032304431.1 synaptonemal complex protein 2 isoform X1 [Coturnix japonica]